MLFYFFCSLIPLIYLREKAHIRRAGACPYSHLTDPTVIPPNSLSELLLCGGNDRLPENVHHPGPTGTRTAHLRRLTSNPTVHEGSSASTQGSRTLLPNTGR